MVATRLAQPPGLIRDVRVLVLGAGGTSGYYGGRLQQGGAQVVFLTRPATTARLQRERLRIRSRFGDATLPVIAGDGSGAPFASPFDLVILGCKSFDLGSALAAIQPFVGDASPVLPLLNGLGHLDRLDGLFGRHNVLGGLSYIGSTVAPTGEIVHLNHLDTLIFGPRGDTHHRLCTEALTLWRQAGTEAVLSTQIEQEMWEKFVYLATLSGMTCLMRAPIGAILEAADGEALLRDFLAECESVAAASGAPVRPEARARALDILTTRGSRFTASMLRDLESGRRIETDHIVGDMLRRGRAFGLPMPLLRAAHAHLQARDARRSMEPEASPASA